MFLNQLKENHFQSINDNKEATGTYCCTACGHPLFDASKHFEAGCGFPSFWMHLEEGVRLNPLHTYGRDRIQLLCQKCGLHLGHLFPNKHTPSGVRYCINKAAIKLVEQSFLHCRLNRSAMASTTLPIEEIMFTIREHRSSESNYEILFQQLEKAIAMAQSSDNTILAEGLQEVNEKYAAEYQKAKETGGSAWPEFEKFVTQFERTLTNAAKENQ